MQDGKRFLTSRERSELPAIARTRKGDHLAGVCATAILRLDDDRSPACAAKALQVSVNAVRVPEEFGIEYSRRGACKPVHRLGFAESKHFPKVTDEQSQRDFIKPCNRIMNCFPPTESVAFADAVHPEHRSRLAFGRFPKGSRPAVGATSGRRRLNPCGAFNLEEMSLAHVEGERTDGEATLRLLRKIEADYPERTRIHVFLDNARYNHARMLKPWLERRECRLKLRCPPPCWGRT